MTRPEKDPYLVPPPEPELRALIGVFALYHFIETNMDVPDAACDLPHFERKILVSLDHPKRIGTLAREMNVLPSTMTVAADQLELHGLAQRARDPDDRRAWLLTLTEKGQAQRTELVALARALLCDTLGLSEDELHGFAKIAAKIHTNIRHLTTN
ncbi:MarR family winged helix-turn-helix transcriptional regulator [Aliiroseovarius marinus]|uniref:MarR family winged helix-turn-helix transcriptional regulator n=1 Tax=Aliiroseovarius marinus TaxID=2500159 RepID=UPI003D7DC6F3